MSLSNTICHFQLRYCVIFNSAVDNNAISFRRYYISLIYDLIISSCLMYTGLCTVRLYISPHKVKVRVRFISNFIGENFVEFRLCSLAVK